MWKTIKFRIRSGWRLLALFNVGIVCFAIAKPFSIEVLQGTLFVLEDRSKLIFMFLLLTTLSILIVIFYRDNDIGKQRWLLLRKHQVRWIFSDMIIVVVQLLFVYLVLYASARAGIYEMINSVYQQQNDVYVESVFAMSIAADWFSNYVLQITVLSSGMILLGCIVAGLWSHNIAVNFLYLKRTVYDWLIHLSILACCLLQASWVLGCIVLIVQVLSYLYYGKNLWSLTKMTK